MIIFNQKFKKIAQSVISQPIANIFNTSIKTSKFPTRCKEAQVTPNYKKDDALQKSYCRPVGILSTISKIYEKILDDPLKPFIEDTLSDLISAFRSGYSCQHLLLHQVEKWRTHLDNHEVVGALLTDLSKAFTSIKYKIERDERYLHGGII